jgi:hypothetical protein
LMPVGRDWTEDRQEWWPQPILHAMLR